MARLLRGIMNRFEGRWRPVQRQPPVRVVPVSVGTFTGHGTTVVDAPGPRTEMVLVALAVGTPRGTGTRRTLAGVGKAS
jgi:hypothetical protein